MQINSLMSPLVRFFSFLFATRDTTYGRSRFMLLSTCITYSQSEDKLKFGIPTSISNNPLSARTIPSCEEKSGLFGLYSILILSSSIPSMSKPTNGINSSIFSNLIPGRDSCSVLHEIVMTGISVHSLASPNCWHRDLGHHSD